MTAPSIKEVLRKLVYRIRQRSTNKLHNREFAMTLDDCVRELTSLSTLSPPAGERREAIALALAEKWPGDYMQGDDECERGPNELAYETADLILASGLVQDEAAIAFPKPTEAQVRSACLSFRHDYGLLPKEERDKVQFAAREWLYAWQKEGFAAATRLQQERDEAYERAATIADNPPKPEGRGHACIATGRLIASAIRRLAAGPEK